MVDALTVAASAARPVTPVVTAVSTFHVHARIFSGTLDAPTRNELQSAETDDRDEVMGLAEELSARGFTVWVYQHDHRPGPNGHQAPYRVIAEWQPGVDDG